MGVLSAIGSFVGGLFTSNSQKGIAEQAADIVDRWAPSEEKKHEMQMDVSNLLQKSVQDARAMPLGNTATWFDSFVNGINRLIRPAITIGLFGGLWGFWPLPAPGNVDPLVMTWIQTVLVFWFGGRFVIKDIPSAIAYLKAVRGN